MLIGGPNQSYKVNFKEPLPRRGKISKKTSAFAFVNTFSEKTRKNVERNVEPSRPFNLHRRDDREVLIEGIAENAIWVFLIKFFLIISANNNTTYLWINIKELVFLRHLTGIRLRIFGNTEQLRSSRLYPFL
jgi:hypothetical protein